MLSTNYNWRVELVLLLLRVKKQPPRDSCRCEELDKTGNVLVLLHVFWKNI